ncbi:restriction endonuclease [Micromonospora haikouensis]|uniref:restriction endonuclease n=1 Tax=Micromonospora haikouensis TaxID=686309 RepID=UPI00118730E5|nr:hypothetical protein [Micromonospora haikouensis]
MLNDPSRWRRLVAEYRALDRLDGGLTPQKRGQRFNGLVAELLTVFGIPAKADQRSVGELDVTFRHAGRPFILEAKWERQKTGTGPIAKLQRRVEQRMVGVAGVFLAMEGYTAEALDEVVRGRRLDIVLLDRTHWEAMLSGFVPPQELLDLVVDAAAFKGEAHAPLHRLLDRKPAALTVHSAGPNHPLLLPPLTSGAGAFLEVAESPYFGLSATGPETVLVTLDEGVAAVDLATGQARWETGVGGCSDAALRLPDGSLLLARAHGVGRYHDGVVSAIASGSAHEHCGRLLIGPDGSVWCFDPGWSKAGQASVPSLIRLGGSLGEEEHHPLPSSGSPVVAAAWLDDGRCAVATGTRVSILSGPGQPVEREFSLGPDVTGLAPLGGGQLLVLDAASVLHAVPRDADEVQPLAAFKAEARRMFRLATDGRAAVLVAAQDRAGASTVLGIHRIGDGDAPLCRPYVPYPARFDNKGSTAPARLAGSTAPVTARLSPPSLPSSVPSVTVPMSPSRQPRSASTVHPASAENLYWHSEQERAEVDARRLATELPLYAIEALMAANFDVRSWLQPWREAWRSMSVGDTPPDGSLLRWLPMAARSLGVHAEPDGAAEAGFRPSPAYLVGFGAGLRAVVGLAVAQRLIPGDAHHMAQWLRDVS